MIRYAQCIIVVPTESYLIEYSIQGRHKFRMGCCRVVEGNSVNVSLCNDHQQLCVWRSRLASFVAILTTTPDTSTTHAKYQVPECSLPHMREDIDYL